MWSDWSVFCDCGFQSVYPLMEKDNRLMEASQWERLTGGKLGLLLLGGAMLNKSLIQFSFEGQTVFPPCYLTWGQTMVEVIKIMATSFKRSHAGTVHSLPPILQQATTDPRLHWDSWTLMGKSESAMGSLLLSPGSWCTQGSVCALQEPHSPVLCKFW